MKKIILTIISLILLTTNVNALELNSKYAVLYNLNEEKPLLEIQKDEKTSIASLTKIMTTLVAIENIKDYNKKITLDNKMFKGLKEANAYVIGLKGNQTVTYNDLLYGMFLASGADATRALAISIAGSEENFIEKMNQKAKELNLKNTHFTNTVGLDDKEHYSTVNEVAKILKEALKNVKFKEIFETESYTFKDNSITVINSMKSRAKDYNIDTKEILGAKTGYTGEAGRCLASLALDKENNITYLLVTTNAKTIKEPIIDAKEVYNYYFQNYKYHTLIEKGELLVTLKTKYSKAKNVKIYAEKEISKYLKNDFNKDEVKIKYNGKKIITPSIKKNEKLGQVKIIYQDEVVEEINIKLKTSVKFSLLVFIKVHKIIFTIITLLLIIIICLILKKE